MEKVVVTRRLAMKECFLALEDARSRRREVARDWLGDCEVRNPFLLRDCCVIEQLLDRHICEYFSTANVIAAIVRRRQVILSRRTLQVMDAWRGALERLQEARMQAFLSRVRGLSPPSEACTLALIHDLTAAAFAVGQLLGSVYRKKPPV